MSAFEADRFNHSRTSPRRTPISVGLAFVRYWKLHFTPGKSERKVMSFDSNRWLCVIAAAIALLSKVRQPSLWLRTSSRKSIFFGSVPRKVKFYAVLDECLSQYAIQIHRTPTNISVQWRTHVTPCS